MPLQDLPITFGEYLPDQGTVLSPNLVEALNVVPVSTGYGPVPTFTGTGATLPAANCGAAAFFDSTGEPVVYAAAVASGLYVRVGDAWVAASTGLSPAGGDRVRFAQFGTHVVAVSHDFPTQKASVNAPLTPFAALAGSPPRAKYAARVRDQLMLAFTKDSAGYHPNRVQFSPFNDIEGPWVPPNQNLQTDFQDLQSDLGEITGILGGEIATIFCKRGIVLGTYTGDKLIYRFDVVVQGQGCIAPDSLVRVGNRVFFLSEEGFVMWDGQGLTPIGVEKIDRWFKERLDYPNRGRISAAIDYPHTCIAWSFTATTDDAATLLFYSWTLNRWTRAVLADGCEMVLALPQRGLLVDELTGEIDDYTGYVDAWARGNYQLAVFDGTHELAISNGTPIAATIETGDLEAMPNYRAFVGEVRPVVEGGATAGSITTAIGVRAQLAWGAITYATAVAMNAIGFCPQRATGRYLRVRMALSGSDWVQARGLVLRFRREGRR